MSSSQCSFSYSTLLTEFTSIIFAAVLQGIYNLSVIGRFTAMIIIIYISMTLNFHGAKKLHKLLLILSFFLDFCYFGY